MTEVTTADTAFARWLQALDERHLANLRVPEVTRALRALSSVYVERRAALSRGAALDSAGKRAAFALFYGPLHYLIVRHVVRSLGVTGPGIDVVIDAGCGTGAGGAAWALSADSRRGTDPQIHAEGTGPQIHAEGTGPQIHADSRRFTLLDRPTTDYQLPATGVRPTTDYQLPATGVAPATDYRLPTTVDRPTAGYRLPATGVRPPTDYRLPTASPRVLGVDRHPWAVAEAAWTYKVLGLHGTARREDVTRTRLSGKGSAVVLAFTANELPDEARAALLPRLIRAAGEGAHVLVVEPLARSIGAWWDRWASAVREAGGREDTWRFEAELPDRVRQLDRAAGLDHRVLTARSLYLAGAKSG